MKTKPELEQIAFTFFKKNTQKEVYVTPDGQLFLDENRAALHADTKNITYQKYTDGFVAEFQTQNSEPVQDVLDVENTDLDAQTKGSGLLQDVLDTAHTNLDTSQTQNSEPVQDVLDVENTDLDTQTKGSGLLQDESDAAHTNLDTSQTQNSELVQNVPTAKAKRGNTPKK